MNKIFTIKKTNVCEKWLEFWFEEEIKLKDILDSETYEPTGEKEETWLHCCKTYMFYNCLKEVKIDIESKYEGLKTEWEFDGINWNLKKVFKSDFEYKDPFLGNIHLEQVKKYCCLAGIRTLYYHRPTEGFYMYIQNTEIGLEPKVQTISKQVLNDISKFLNIS